MQQFKQVPDVNASALTQQKLISQSLWRQAIRRMVASKLVVVCLVIILLYVVIALAVAFGLVADNWDEVVGDRYLAPSWEHPLGTDIYGQSVLRKTLYGAKTSLTVAAMASGISILIGLPIGAIAGYFGRWIDEVIVWLYSTLQCIPYIVLIMAFAFVLRDKVLFDGTRFELKLAGIAAVYVALGLTSWVGLCRLIRGEVIKHKQRDYVAAAKAFGASNFYVIFRHIVPNVFHLVIINLSLSFVSFIQAEVILSYLGLGEKNLPSWGVMIDDAKSELVGQNVWWQLVAATVAIFLISLALNIVGDALRDAMDPKLRGH